MLALASGAFLERPYLACMTPIYAAASTVIARLNAWTVLDVQTTADPHSPGRVLRLRGLVANRSAPSQSALIISRLQVGAPLETLVVFWALLVACSLSSRRRLLLSIALGVPVFLGIEAAMTVSQLVGPLASAPQLLAGAAEPMTPWEHWSRFLEAGGRVAVGITAALMTAALTEAVLGSSAHH